MSLSPKKQNLTQGNRSSIVFEIVAVSDFRYGIQPVFDLYDRNKEHLGFLPYCAFEPFIERNEILIAHEEGDVQDWLSGELDLCVTTELLEDVKRSGKPEDTERVRKNLDAWTMLHSTENEAEEHLIDIEQVLGPATNARTASDHRHLAISIVNGATAFVTRDAELIKHANQFFEQWGISICRPSELIIEFDPRFAHSIFSGRKTVELRKRRPRVNAGSTAVIYSTSPVLVRNCGYISVALYTGVTFVA